MTTPAALPSGRTANSEARPRRRIRLGALMLALGMLLLGVTHGSGVFSATRAEAATNGAGIDVAGIHAGAYITATNQSTAYCIEPGGEDPANEVPAVEMTSLRGYTMHATGHWVAPYTNEHGLRMMNYVLSNYGGVAAGPAWADVQAAAVALSLWTIRGWDDAVVSAWVQNLRSLLPANVLQQADQFLAEANTYALPTPTLIDPAEPTVAWTSATSGTVTVPEGHHELRIGTARVNWSGAAPTGATYNAARSVATLDATRSHQLPFTYSPTASSPNQVEVLFVAEWSQQATGWPARLWGFQPPAGEAGQLLLAGAGPEPVERAGTWRHTAQSDPRVFQPIVTTQVPAHALKYGDVASDEVVFAAAGNEPWPQYTRNGETEYRRVRATGILYGPFASAPMQTSAVPDPTPPIAGTAEIEAVGGPGTYYAQLEAGEALEAGYYTWVWEINGRNQPSDIQTGPEGNWHIAPDYRFLDDFGIPAESQVRPMDFNVETALADNELAPGQDTEDHITLSVTNGAWIEIFQDPGMLDDGEPTGEIPVLAPVPIVVRTSVYETDGAPEQQSAPPEGAVPLSQQFTRVQPAEAEGETNQSTATTLVPLDLQFLLTGGITVQACVLAEDQDEAVRDLITDTCDDWGVPAESARVVPPNVTTQAQESVMVGEEMTDLANVSGLIPAASSIGFTVYLRPEAGEVKMDSTWQQVTDERGRPQFWRDAELAEMTEAERCVAQPVGNTERMNVSDAGEVRSPGVVARSAGTVYWVEDLVTAHPKLQEPVELHRGVCGLAEETTIVVPPEEPPHGDTPPPPADEPPTGKKTPPSGDKPPLPSTGSNLMAVSIWGGVLIILGGGIALGFGNKQILRRLRK